MNTKRVFFSSNPMLNSLPPLCSLLALTSLVSTTAWAQIRQLDRMEGEPIEALITPANRAPIGGTPPPGAAPPPLHGGPRLEDPKATVGQGAGPTPSTATPAGSNLTARTAVPKPEPSQDKGTHPGGQGQHGNPSQGNGSVRVADPSGPGAQTNVGAFLQTPSAPPAVMTSPAPTQPAAQAVGQPNTQAGVVTQAGVTVPSNTTPSPSTNPTVSGPVRPKPVGPGAGETSAPNSGSLSYPSAAARSGAGLGEILPSLGDLSSSLIPAGSVAKPMASEPNVTARVAQPACVPISFKPDPARNAVTLVDFSGDGLIVSAIPNTHINAVFARAGYRPIDIQQPVRWCVAQSAARELLGPSYGYAAQAHLLVPTKEGVQLMTQEQWQAQQAAIKPEPMPSTVAKRTSQTVRAAASRVGRSPIARAAGTPPRFIAKPLPALR
jgi:hypothetical protein